MHLSIFSTVFCFAISATTAVSRPYPRPASENTPLSVQVPSAQAYAQANSTAPLCSSVSKGANRTTFTEQSPTNLKSVSLEKRGNIINQNYGNKYKSAKLGVKKIRSCLSKVCQKLIDKQKRGAKDINKGNYGVIYEEAILEGNSLVVEAVCQALIDSNSEEYLENVEQLNKVI